MSFGQNPAGNDLAPLRPVIRALNDRGARALLLVTIVIGGSACGTDRVTTPTSATTVTATTVADASLSEEFSGTLPTGSSAFYSFGVTQYGTVNITLTSVGGTYVPSTTWLGLGIGTPSGTDCTTTSTANVQAGSGAQLTGVYDVGVYCAKVWDIGNLYAPARFTIVIAHP